MVVRIDNHNFIEWRDQIEKLIIDSARVNFPKVLAPEEYAENKCNELQTYIDDGRAIVYAAIEGSDLAGWIWIHEISRMNEKRVHISEIAINEPYRRKGIGNMLLAQVEEYAKEHGYSAIDLLVTKSNKEAVAFYRNASFEIERYVMRKALL